LKNNKKLLFFSLFSIINNIVYKLYQQKIYI
jgi:hypothetical protein